MPLNMNFISRNGRDFAGVSPNFIVELFEEIFNQCYPVGCYFETTDTNFNPNVAWSGTWVLEDAGLVHVSAGTGYAVTTNSKDGGEATHTLSISEMPNHNHGGNTGVGYTPFMRLVAAVGTAASANHMAGRGSAGYVDKQNTYDFPSGNHYHGITAQGGGGAHNNMQPYKIVNRWHRTA